MASLSELNAGLQPWAFALIQTAEDYGYRPVVTSVLRSFEQQSSLYQRLLAGLSPFPAASFSAHEFGLAFDVSDSPTALADMGQLWESWGGTWGGRFHPTDPVHFEAPGASAWVRSLSLQDKVAFYNEIHGVELNAGQLPF